MSLVYSMPGSQSLLPPEFAGLASGELWPGTHKPPLFSEAGPIGTFGDNGGILGGA
jgi:hypothetical protein